jgi:hypothetical protein
MTECIQTLGRMKGRVKAETAELAVAGALIIADRARVNILDRFVNRTMALYHSMYSDPTAKPIGVDEFSARAFPRGGYMAGGTPYGRIQELGGLITAHNPTGKLWFTSIRDDGTVGLISVPEVHLHGRFYLRDAVIEGINSGELLGSARDHWRTALET